MVKKWAVLWIGQLSNFEKLQGNAISMTPTQRVQALRQRRKALGLTRVEFYLTPEHAAKVRGYVSKLTKEKTK